MLFLLQVLKSGFSNLDSIRILSMHVIKAGLRLLFVNRKSVTIDIRAATALLRDHLMDDLLFGPCTDILYRRLDHDVLDRIGFSFLQ